MKLQDYLEQKKRQGEALPVYRTLCTDCLQPSFSCYCGEIKRFDSKIDFVILIHPIEVKRRIATGRMSYLCLENSYLIKGQDYSQDETVNRLLQDPSRECMILYPGKTSINLTEHSSLERKALFKPEKRLTLFVVDGTWATAKKIMRQSQNLLNLPRICFSPEKPSTFRVRKQPNINYYSTLEAIHHTIDLIGDAKGFDVASRAHDNLRHVFDTMVERQLDFVKQADEKNDPRRYRVPRFISRKPQVVTAPDSWFDEAL